jgi:hypothetical protein
VAFRRVRDTGAQARGLTQAPFALALVSTLLATTVWTRLHPDHAERVLRWASTNVHNLSVAPVRSMLMSALFLPDQRWLLNACVLLAAIIPLERRLGTVRTLCVFASAHVLATLVTEGWVFFQIQVGAMPLSAEYQDDVGVSYGLFCVAAAAMFLLPRRIRALAVTGLVAYTVIPFVLEPDMTTTGHVLSVLIGFLWWPLLRTAAAKRALRRG